MIATMAYEKKLKYSMNQRWTQLAVAQMTLKTRGMRVRKYARRNEPNLGDVQYILGQGE